MDAELLKVNISGRRFEVPKALVERALQNQRSTASKFTTGGKGTGEYYFPRNVVCFEAALDYLTLNELHMPLSVCPAVFKREMDFWGIDVQELQSCCKLRLEIFLDEREILNQYQTGTLTTPPGDGRESWRSFLHRSLETPYYSVFGKIYFWLAMTFVGLSTFVLCAETLPYFRSDLSREDWRNYLGEDYDDYSFAEDYDDYSDVLEDYFYNDESSEEGSFSNSTFKKKLPSGTYSPNNPLMYLYIVCGAFFSADIFLRFAVSQNKFRFFTSILNIVDIVAVIAFHCRVVLVAVFPKLQYIESYTDYTTAIGCIRVFRIFRLIGQSKGLHVFLLSVKAGIREIWLLVLFLFIGMLVFSSFLYLFERPNNIESIPGAFWWSIVTMTTVGYGDVVPKSTLGKLLGSLCAVSGVLVMAVTVPLFANKFALYYNRIGHIKSRGSNKLKGNSKSCVTPIQRLNAFT